jgi:Zn-dependent peptidase ImmA (M78 family)
LNRAAPNGDPEDEADAFAGESLAPAALFRPDLRGVTFDRLPNLKMYWRLSMKGIIKRGQAIGAIDRHTATRFYKQHSARGYSVAEPYPPSPDRPRCYNRPSTLIYRFTSTRQTNWQPPSASTPRSSTRATRQAGTRSRRQCRQSV